MQMKYRDFNAVAALLQQQKLAEAEEKLRGFDLDEPITPYARDADHPQTTITTSPFSDYNHADAARVVVVPSTDATSTPSLRCHRYLRFNAANSLGICLVTIKKKLRNDGKTWYNVVPEAIQ